MLYRIKGEKIDRQVEAYSELDARMRAGHAILAELQGTPMFDANPQANALAIERAVKNAYVKEMPR